MSRFVTRLKSCLQIAMIVALSLFAVPAVAESAANSEQVAVDFVKATAEHGLTFLSQPNASTDQKKQEFKKLLNGSFDMDTIGKFAMGTYWRSATPAQQKEYLTLFRKMVVNVYAQRFGDYKGQKFEVKSARPVTGGDALVTSYIVPQDGGENIQVDWRVRNKSGSPKIVDVLVEGVSMSVTQRADFSSVIQQGGGGVDALLTNLRKR